MNPTVSESKISFDGPISTLRTVVSSVAIDAAGDVVLAGHFWGSFDFEGDGSPTVATADDAYVASYRIRAGADGAWVV